MKFRYATSFNTWREFVKMRADIAGDCLLSLAPGVYGHMRESLCIVIEERKSVDDIPDR